MVIENNKQSVPFIFVVTQKRNKSYIQLFGNRVRVMIFFFILLLHLMLSASILWEVFTALISLKTVGNMKKKKLFITTKDRKLNLSIRRVLWQAWPTKQNHRYQRLLWNRGMGKGNLSFKPGLWSRSRSRSRKSKRVEKTQASESESGVWVEKNKTPKSESGVGVEKT